MCPNDGGAAGPWTAEESVRLANPDSTPDPPDSIPNYILEGLERQDAETLRAIARHSLRLAISLEAEAQRELEQQTEGESLEDPPDDWEGDDDEWEATVREARAEKDIPSKAYRHVKTINGRDYVYAHWREGGDSIETEYICPVVPVYSDPKNVE